MNGYDFTERLQRVLAYAKDEAIKLNHEYVGTEHLLLGLIREGEGIAAAALTNLGVNLDVLRHRIHATVVTGSGENTAGSELPFTSRSKKSLELAMDEARRLEHTHVGTEHLALGLLREEHGIAAQLLMDAGGSEGQLRAEIQRLTGEGTRPYRGSVTTAQKTFKTVLRPAWPHELDALVAAPEQHRLLMENPRVRVLDTLIAPGERTPVHTHQWPAVHYVASWSDFVRRDPDDNVLLDTRASGSANTPPAVLWGEPLAPHSLENVGLTPLHIVSVELKS